MFGSRETKSAKPWGWSFWVPVLSAQTSKKKMQNWHCSLIRALETFTNFMNSSRNVQQPPLPTESVLIVSKRRSGWDVLSSLLLVLLPSISWIAGQQNWAQDSNMVMASARVMHRVGARDRVLQLFPLSLREPMPLWREPLEGAITQGGRTLAAVGHVLNILANKNGSARKRWDLQSPENCCL